MSKNPGVPELGRSPEAHADWLELQAIRSSTRFVSWADYRRDVSLAFNEDEAEAEFPDLVDPLEDLLNNVAEELQDREVSCREDIEFYPFRVSAEGLEYTDAGVIYLYLLLMSVFGKDAGPADEPGARLFEDLSADVLKQYLGGSDANVSAFVFGFPRRVLPTAFRDAVNQLCKSLNEGVQCRNEPEVNDMKDAALDIIAWTAFADRKPGQLLVLGQCATGNDWYDKVSSLQPSQWCKLWLVDQPAVDPVPAFFIPHRPERKKWRRAAVSGGILFDRCRMSSMASGVSHELLDRVSRWISFVLPEDES